MAILVECPVCKHRQGGEVEKCKKCKASLEKYSGKFYWIEYRINGRRKRERIGHNRALAETVLHKRLVERAEGKWLDRRKVSNQRFSELASQYDEWSKTNNKSYEVNKKYYISKVKEHFGPMLLREITAWHVEKFKSERSKETGKYEVNRELATVKHMLSKAVEWGKIQINPAKGVKKLKENKSRFRFLMPDEFFRLYEHLPDWMKPITRVAVLTGLRKENILGLKWSHIDFRKKTLNIPETKNAEPLKIDMNQPMVDLLQSIKKHPESDYVFYQSNGSRYRNISFDHFREALKEAGLDENIHFHDLRHSVASNLVMDGEDLATIKEILGHKDIAMTMKYAHLAPDHKKKAMERLGVIFSMDTYMDTKANLPQKKGLAKIA